MAPHLALGLAVLIAAGLATLGIIKPAEWAAEVGTPAVWRVLHLVAGIAGGSAGAFMAYNAPIDRPLLLLAAASGASALGVTFVIALATDFRARKVDRILLNRAILISIPFALAYLIKDEYIDRASTANAIVTVMFFALAAFVYFFVFAIGASDARSMMLIAVASLPVSGIGGLVTGVTFASFAFIFAAVGLGIYHRSFKVSMPAAPLLIGPFLFALLQTRF